MKEVSTKAEIWYGVQVDLPHMFQWCKFQKMF